MKRKVKIFLPPIGCEQWSPATRSHCATNYDATQSLTCKQCVFLEAAQLPILLPLKSEVANRQFLFFNAVNNP